ncbi:conjugative transposon protein TraN [Sphingobacterium bambusae]|uniref:Conjugative transposon protein TraN n=1 Tax=Sphingobacterium bambusae TaxID=662858 RepID=A0ABW6BBC4_9SPHI|nr:conjugative transposon protein TraN [Sphingobacterium bambusae]WPL49192.1 conjugative transposon protein TraN [Sphingobacterium bambusae]
MKNIIKISLIALLHLISIELHAQHSNTIHMKVIPASYLELTCEKTTHLIFPAKISYVDLGSEAIVADKVTETSNILRIKASAEPLLAESNLAVVTDDGSFYSFLVRYNQHPQRMSYAISKSRCKDADENEIYFEKFGETSASKIKQLLEQTYNSESKTLKRSRSKKRQIEFSLTDLSIHNSQYYLRLNIKNLSIVPLHVRDLNFQVVDRKLAKRTVAQQIPVVPLKHYKPLTTIDGKASESTVILLDQFPITEKQRLIIELRDQHGSRNQKISLKLSDLLQAKKSTTQKH